MLYAIDRQNLKISMRRPRHPAQNAENSLGKKIIKTKRPGPCSSRPVLLGGSPVSDRASPAAPAAYSMRSGDPPGSGCPRGEASRRYHAATPGPGHLSAQSAPHHGCGPDSPVARRRACMGHGGPGSLRFALRCRDVAARPDPARHGPVYRRSTSRPGAWVLAVPVRPGCQTARAKVQQPEA